MKSLIDQMSIYAAFHRNPANKAIHFVFVPLITWSAMGLLSLWGIPAPALGITLTPALVLSTLLLVYYIRLDFALGLAMVVFFTFLLGTAAEVVALTGSSALPLFLAVFALSWVAQIAGHQFFEHRRPAFTVNLWQVFVAPIFVVAEWAFALGMRRELHDAVQPAMPAKTG